MTYPSRYSPGKNVPAAQYITELICEKRAIHLRRDLPIKFWNLDEWKGYYMYQLKLARKLLDKYDAHIIVKALEEVYNVYSLKSPILTKKMNQLHKRALNKWKAKQTSTEPPVLSKPIAQELRLTTPKENLLGRLKSLDSE